MSQPEIKLPEGAVELPKKIQERLTVRLQNIHTIQQQANQAIAQENAYILEMVETAKDAMGIEGQYGLLETATHLVPVDAPVAEEAPAVEETHDVAPAEEAPVAEAERAADDGVNYETAEAETSAETEEAPVAEAEEIFPEVEEEAAEEQEAIQ
jgi:hypothetical protein